MKADVVKTVIASMKEDIGEDKMAKLLIELFPSVVEEAKKKAVCKDAVAEIIQLIVENAGDINENGICQVLDEIWDSFTDEMTTWIIGRDFIDKDDILDHVRLNFTGDGETEGSVEIEVND